MSVEPKVFDHVKKILASFNGKYMTGDVLKRTAIIEDLDKYDDQLMEALLSDQLIHDTYTKKIAGVEVFEVNQFVSMLEFKDYWEDSYTKYSNKIGLAAGGKFIDENEDVVLDFPYKDCVLKAGMTKEDAKDNDEPFLNEVIAKPEIDEMLEPKIFVNAKKYDKDGVHDATGIDDSDNLIIKGNNLIALYSLKERYAGKVKLIYLDPPYNTGSDSFAYNDSFSRSTWLTFIKSRIEIAKELLADTGVLLVQTSFHQFPYLRVLLDEILEHVFDMNLLVRHPERTLAADKSFNDVMEYTLIYSKDTSFVMPKKIVKKTPEKYNYQISTTSKPDEIIDLGNKKVEVFYPEHIKVEKTLPGVENLHRETIRGSIREKNSSGRFYVAYLEDLRGKYPHSTIFKVPDMGDDGLGYRYFELPKSDKTKNGAYYQGMPTSSDVTKKPYPNFMDFLAEYNKANNEGGYSFRNGKKPEKLIQRYLEMFTQPGDLVLDFFMGSATTQAVAMKMHRHFIGIEQMDYINTVSVPRLQKVIEGEQGGISKDVDWQGGGSFVYAELMEKNRGYIKDVMSAEKMPELLDVFERMKATTDFDFRVDLEKFQQELHDFSDVDEARRELLRILDKNQLYYNYANIDDSNVRDLVDDADYKFNKSFYED
ncbi:site-specific DNA-methyltransferase [Lactobacillus delbrueckii]|uniref:site-specific DNA-methyltransferase n=1 Tax=Lactobacillus delbrueckii TaxID=1584 RepID=UPI001F2BEE09|nr:site-specific DNA-methyltransferase [Lactobacillus delbrueckii]GHN24561.1 type III restriction-modification system methylation subunit [Lactobacillus delbrueckii]GHN26583.1 type III restriction-modification system methylation subunit [Lactobacillus delbrueckii]GHN28804.1 type III restriction-modification system methylation subunit [Lactobacillus delbrueckii]GHN44317.1 type III restriction-modification system methylation subunit [Lactobacillus delbrueckii]